MRFGRAAGARWAQILAQGLSGGAIVAHLAGWPAVSPWVIVSLAVAAFVPLRTDGTPRDRAVCNFTSGIVLAGLVTWDLVALGLLLATGGWASLPPAYAVGLMITMTAMVLFVFAGAHYWLEREGSGRAPGA